MRFLLILLTATSALALPTPDLPDLEKVRLLLGSEDFEEREAISAKIWVTGRAALPLLRDLAKDDDPEISTRANFVLQRLRMGLTPDSPQDLLRLTKEANNAPLHSRTLKLEEILGHPKGFPSALIFLDQWVSDPITPREHLVTLTETFVESVFEQRKHWQTFLNTPLSARTRGALIGVLAVQDSPHKKALIAILASRELPAVYATLTDIFETCSAETHFTLARIATSQGNLDLALKFLSIGLSTSESPDLARNIAFLEHVGKQPAISYEGAWKNELQLFRARAHGDNALIRHLATQVKAQPTLTYESHLLSGVITIPAEKYEDLFSGNDVLSALKLALAYPPGEPDIEALTSSILINWSELARSLTALAQPIEAAENLAAEGQLNSSIQLLWRSGNRADAIASAETVIADFENRIFANLGESNHTPIRLTLASLYLEDGNLVKAAEYFEPLLTLGITNEVKRRAAIPLALKLFPLEKVVAFEPGLNAAKPYPRQRAIAPFFSCHPKIAVFWYEHFREANPTEDPARLIAQTREFLNTKPAKALALITKQLAASTKTVLVPTDTLYQNALFFHHPEALERVKKAAWYQLSTQDLLGIIRSETWSLETRKSALKTALLIAPADPVLTWFHHHLNDVESPQKLSLLTLGNPASALQLGRLTGKRETLITTAQVANFKDPNTIRCLAILGRAHLKNEQPEKAARLLQAAFCGEIALGVRPSTSIQKTLDNLTDYFHARLEVATNAKEKAIWLERLNRIGKN